MAVRAQQSVTVLAPSMGASQPQEILLAVRQALDDQHVASVRAPRQLLVRMLKETLARITGTPADFQHIMTQDGLLLEDGLTLEAAGLTAGLATVLFARMPSPDSLLDFVKNKFDHMILKPPSAKDLQEEVLLVKYMLDSDADVNARDGTFAPYGGGGDPDAMPEHECFFGATALHYASKLGLSHICRLLLEHDSFAEVDATCRAPLWFNTNYQWQLEEGCTALHCAAASGKAEVCTEIIQNTRFTMINAKTTPMHGNPGGLTAFHVATCFFHRGSNEVLDVFLNDHRVEGNAVDGTGATAIQLAMRDSRTCLYDPTVYYRVILRICDARPEFSDDLILSELAVIFDPGLYGNDDEAMEKEGRGAGRLASMQKDAKRRSHVAAKKHRERAARYSTGGRSKQAETKAGFGHLVLSRALSINAGIAEHESDKFS